jgi:glutamate-1-semialdehyde 2,1-aminomutase
MALAERAHLAIPGGITHDIRYLRPFPVYVDHALGARKWDVDGHEYIDYWMGHGALFLGHGHSAVVSAVQAQVARGTHFGASHQLEVRWAELVNQLVPCAELTRFTMSGTEATHLALRIARAASGRTRIVKLRGHFHGWHDGVVVGVNPPYDIPLSAGVPAAMLDQAMTCPPNDLEALEALLDGGDVAAVILEPAGGQAGVTPMMPGYLSQLRAVTAKRHVVLIFDEVITGFRYAPGGAQAYFGVTPDLTTLGKIVAGGLPGGAVCGRRDLMALIEHRNQPGWDRSQRVAHAGTFNANPVSAAAAVATLELCADATLQARTNRATGEFRQRLDDALHRAGAPGAVYGESSIYHVSFEGRPQPSGLERPRPSELYHLLRCALLNEGVDCSLYHGWVSTVHSDDDLARSVAAYERAFRAMVADGAFERS